MYKKKVLASVLQIDIDKQSISAIPEMQKMHSVNIISPFTIETKECFYADIHMWHNFKVLEDSHDDSHNQPQVMNEQNFTNKNFKDIKPGQ